MKEVLGAARNILLSVSEDASPKMGPVVEVVIIVTEPTFSCDAVGSMIRSRTTETIRFSTSPKGLRSLAKQFTEWATDAEDAKKLASILFSDTPAATPTPKTKQEAK